MTPSSITRATAVVKKSQITAVAITFSQPMGKASVENVMNYRLLIRPTIDFFKITSPLSAFEPSTWDPPLLLVALKAARYHSATDTVLLIPSRPFSIPKSITVASPASLGSTRSRRTNAQPLTDSNGNVLNPFYSPAGSFSVNIQDITS